MNTDYAILVVDDDPELRVTIDEVLTREGFAVNSAGSANRALELLATEQYALVLLDMVMPGTDGLSAITMIRHLAPKIRIIIMTAYASVENAVRAMQQGADDYITKPFKIDILLNMVRQNLAYAAMAENPECKDIDAIFRGLSSELRRQIIVNLEQLGECRFMELVKLLKIKDHTKVNFHLKTLREAGFVSQRQNKCYYLTQAGLRAANCLSMISKGV